MQLGKTTRSFLALTATGILLATACGDGDDNGMDIKDDGVTGGTSGTSAGGTSGAAGDTTGGTSGTSGAGGSGATTGGSAGAGEGGMAGSGEGGEGGEGGEAMGGEGGEATGGTAGGGAGGKAGGGAGGIAGGGMAGGGAGGIAGAGAGGMSGAGMGGIAQTMVYDFESGVQGWGTPTTGASVAQSTAQIKDGANSLALTHLEINASDAVVQVENPPLWPGTVITVNAWLPVGLDTTGGTYFQMFTQYNDFRDYDNAGNSARTAQSGAWTTWTYTVPNTFPNGIQRLGFQIGDNSDGTTIPAGSIFIDSITATGGVTNCAMATPTALHDFETALPANTYLIDGGGNVTVSQSTDRFFGTGTGSLKVSFADLPAPAATDPTKRRIYINRPNVYCGQMMTFHVWLPAGSEAMAVQVFSQFNWFSGFSGSGNLTVTRDDWTTGTHTIPTTVDYRGIQRVGIEFSYTGTAAFTGDAYIDQVTW